MTRNEGVHLPNHFISEFMARRGVTTSSPGPSSNSTSDQSTANAYIIKSCCLGFGRPIDVAKVDQHIALHCPP